MIYSICFIFVDEFCQVLTFFRTTNWKVCSSSYLWFITFFWSLLIDGLLKYLELLMILKIASNKQPLKGCKNHKMSQQRIEMAWEPEKINMSCYLQTPDIYSLFYSCSHIAHSFHSKKNIKLAYLSIQATLFVADIAWIELLCMARNIRLLVITPPLFLFVTHSWLVKYFQ